MSKEYGRLTEYRCFGCTRPDGWQIDVVLFEGPTGELRAYRDGARQWTHPIGLVEIAMFVAKRVDLLEPYLDAVITQHAHDVLG
jgi:hypothetical protein